MKGIDLIAYNFLKNKYDKNQIVYRKNKFYRFITNNGIRYVVRKVYGRVAWFYRNQMEELKNQENCHILLIDELNNITEIPSTSIDCNTIINGIYIKCVEEGKQTKKIIKLPNDIYKKLVEIKRNKSWEEFFMDVLNYYKDKTENINFNILTSETIAAVGILLLYKQKKSKELMLLDKLVEPKKLDKLNEEEKKILDELIRYKLVSLDGTGDSILCKTVVIGYLNMKPQYQELVVYYMPDFCRKYCSFYTKCQMNNKGGTRSWRLPLTDDIQELIRSVVLDVCK